MADTTGRDARVERALAQIDGWITESGVSAAAAAVWHRGEVIAERYAGEVTPGVPIDGRTLFALASVTKPVTAAVAMSLVDEGLIGLDEPVTRFVPEFARATVDETGPFEAGRRLIGLRQLLSHTSGLPEDLPPGTLPARGMPDLQAITDALIGQSLVYEPGTQLIYSNAGYALICRVVERVTGHDLWDEARARILDPLGLDDVVARPAGETLDRIPAVIDARNAGTDYEGYNSAYFRGLAMPWAGLCGSAPDLARLAGAFLSGGGPLSCAGSRMMTTDQAGGVSGGVQSMRVTWEPAHWGFGWEVKGGKRRHWTGELTSPATFCHFGATGTLLWADPAHDLALAVLGNRMTTHLWPFVPASRWARLSNAVVAAVDR